MRDDHAEPTQVLHCRCCRIIDWQLQDARRKRDAVICRIILRVDSLWQHIAPAALLKCFPDQVQLYRPPLLANSQGRIDEASPLCRWQYGYGIQPGWPFPRCTDLHDHCIQFCQRFRPGRLAQPVSLHQTITEGSPDILCILQYLAAHFLRKIPGRILSAIGFAKQFPTALLCLLCHRLRSSCSFQLFHITGIQLSICSRQTAAVVMEQLYNRVRFEHRQPLRSKLCGR